MSDEEVKNETTTTETDAGESKDPKKMLGNVAGTFSALKESNPKVLYGGIGGVVLLLLILMMGGDDGPVIAKGPVISNLEVGKTYTLKQSNTYDPNAVVRLVQSPGNLKAYDDTDEDDRTGCHNVKQGAKVKVTEFFDYGGAKKTFSKVKVLDGECTDYVGWTLSINVR